MALTDGEMESGSAFDFFFPALHANDASIPYQDSASKIFIPLI